MSHFIPCRDLAARLISFCSSVNVSQSTASFLRIAAFGFGVSILSKYEKQTIDNKES
jgi:hypothetical protein